MTIHITNKTELVATWEGPWMYIPEVNDILLVDGSFYLITNRIFTKEDVRLEVNKLDIKTELDGQIIEFQKSL